ncbi:hypothetical protein CsatB_005259 [Cannabis sativa]
MLISSANNRQCLETMSTQIFNIISDDLLLEVLLRLPDFKSIIDCACVCKHWFSVIYCSRLYFSGRFNHYHRQKRLNNSPDSPLPFALFFIASFLPDYSFSLAYFSPRSTILDYGLTPSLKFLPSKDVKSDRVDICSSFEDLLLVELLYPDRSGLCFYVCNPFLRHYILLPWCSNIYRYYSRRFLVVSNTSNNLMISYKVVIISAAGRVFDKISESLPDLDIFSSETGQWSHSTFDFPKEALTKCSSRSTIIGSNGIVYLPYGSSNKNEGIVSLNICSKRYRLIGLPKEELGRDWRCLDSRVHIGVVRGKVRLAQFYSYKKKECFVFKAWELIDGGDNDDDETYSWNLVHNHYHMTMRFDCPMSFFCLVALHPDDGDVFFFSRSNNRIKDNIEIFQCRILGQNYNHIEILCRLPSKVCATNLRVIPLLHPWWPSQISSQISSVI